MHSYFIDTSALFKRYVEEQGSEVVDSIFSESAEKHISTISILELLSNLQRLHLIDKIMSSSQFTAAWTAFSLDLADGTLQTVNAAAQVINRAVDCLQACYVTPIDALQLASAESLGDVILVSSDRKLSRLALEKGMRVTDPCAAIRNNYNEVSKLCKESGEPVYLPKNGDIERGNYFTTNF